jgi:prepilin-type N-terminal cleavage/methylation domain-containing protein
MRTFDKDPGYEKAVSEFSTFAGDRMHRSEAFSRHARGFTLVELMIVVAILGLLTSIAIPCFARYRTTARTNLCVSNLRQLDECKQNWAVDHNKGSDDIPTDTDVVPYLRSAELPNCPSSGVYTLRRVARTPVCNLYDHGHTLNSANLEEDALSD